MTRGIHLKQLTRADLELLGLPEDDIPIPPGQAHLCLSDAREEGLGAPPRRAGPPSNPVSGIGQAEKADPDLDWTPLDLRALACDLRRELEITLRLLDGSAGEWVTLD